MKTMMDRYVLKVAQEVKSQEQGVMFVEALGFCAWALKKQLFLFFFYFFLFFSAIGKKTLPGCNAVMHSV